MTAENEQPEQPPKIVHEEQPANRRFWVYEEWNYFAALAFTVYDGPRVWNVKPIAGFIDEQEAEHYALALEAANQPDEKAGTVPGTLIVDDPVRQQRNTQMGHRCVLSWKRQHFLTIRQELNPVEAKYIENARNKKLITFSILNFDRWSTSVDVTEEWVPDRGQDLPSIDNRCICAPKPADR